MFTLNEEENDIIQCQLDYMREFLPNEMSIYMDECIDSPLLALHNAQNNCWHKEHMIDKMIINALKKGTIYQNEKYLLNCLRYSSHGKRTVTINDKGHVRNISANNITSIEWHILMEMMKMEIRYADQNYYAELFNHSADVQLNHCEASEFISSNTSIQGNCFSEDADVYGTIYNSPAQKAYFFWIEGLNQLGVIYYSYWS